MSNDGQQAGPHGPEALKRRRRRKNLALAAVLAAFAILVYFVAIVRMGAGS